MAAANPNEDAVDLLLNLKEVKMLFMNGLQNQDQKRGCTRR